MKKFFAVTVSSLALALSTPATAQNTDTPDTAETETAPIDPARLEAAKSTVDYLFPLGTYERMMKGTMDQMMDQMMMSMGNMRMGDLAGAGGVARDDMPDGMGDKTLAEMATEMDPAYAERTKISTKVIMDEMVDLMITMEPAVREALTNIYARKFTVGQLTEMNDFFATDTGSAFARDYMMVFVDPEMMQSMMTMVPEMMQAMPDIMKKVEAATAHLPPVKMPGAGDPFGSVEDAMEDADSSADAVDFEDPENWSAEDRELVDKLSAESDTAFEAYYAALEKAQKNAKAKIANNK
ncbi:DUF2059 domain-containing protein [Parasphingorhabdus cellanae]|uniref:DUF2059 domain-containing protein n=1 Tax=Parasphingorhabdus cellanae TaxID=2806553 RepID=A0ABX7SZC1_9SPHN|nr:DUF2059 domain-containing protein [Parasphingorhabdus cellanae]QTD54623.1 DUF2059 domain-containing protein [Parasphingorhabdus cellanae]